MGEDGEMTAPLVLTPTTVVAGGAALARADDGRVVFIDGALPGEVVEVAIVESKRDFARAAIVRVIESSVRRRDAPCAFVGRGCGGCTWQHIEPGYQPLLKTAIVADALRRTGKLHDAVVRIAPALPDEGFRTSVRMAVDPDGALNYRRVASHELIRVDDCLVAHPGLADLIAEARFPGATEVSLRVSASTGRRTALVEPVTAAAQVPDDVGVGERARLTERVADVDFLVSAGSFFQTRTDGAAALVAEVRAAVGDATGPWLDAYGGVGLFAATLGGDVMLVESSASSCRDARRNLPKGTAIVESTLERWKPKPREFVVADPPRTGLGKDGVRAVDATGANRLVLVSCDAVSLARDAALLAPVGFRHHESVIVDLFPHTPHVEVVTTFVRT